MPLISIWPICLFIIILFLWFCFVCLFSETLSGFGWFSLFAVFVGCVCEDDGVTLKCLITWNKYIFNVWIWFLFEFSLNHGFRFRMFAHRSAGENIFHVFLCWLLSVFRVCVFPLEQKLCLWFDDVLWSLRNRCVNDLYGKWRTKSFSSENSVSLQDMMESRGI